MVNCKGFADQVSGGFLDCWACTNLAFKGMLASVRVIAEKLGLMAEMLGEYSVSINSRKLSNLFSPIPRNHGRHLMI